MRELAKPRSVTLNPRRDLVGITAMLTTKLLKEMENNPAMLSACTQAY